MVKVNGVYDDLCSFQRTKVANINLHNLVFIWNLIKYYLDIRIKLKITYSLGFLLNIQNNYSTPILSLRVINFGNRSHTINQIHLYFLDKPRNISNRALLNIDNQLNLPYTILPRESYDNIIIYDLSSFFDKIDKELDLYPNDKFIIIVYDAIMKKYNSRKIRVSKVKAYIKMIDDRNRQYH